MAWVTHGEILNIHTTERKDDPVRNLKITTTTNVSCSDSDCMALKLVDTINSTVYKYELRIYKQKEVKLSPSGTATVIEKKERPNDPTYTPIINTTHPTNFDVMSGGLKGQSITTNIIDTYELSTAIPMFNDEESLRKYITTGDTSGAVKDASTKWN